mgnify:CR=1 FL=1
MSNLKTYNLTNFFKHTFCEFKEVGDFNFPDNKFFTSKSESKYYYTEKGVFRKSNHWGRVANCRWKLMSKQSYKNQREVIGYANWVDFYPILSNQKLFTISVDYTHNSAEIKPKNPSTIEALFSYSEAQKKVKQINHLLKYDNWTAYYNEEKSILKRKIVDEFITTSKSLVQIKSSFK